MQLTNTSSGYGWIAICLHWLMAIIIIGMIALGLYMTSVPFKPSMLKYFGWHKEFGILILMLVVVRMAWRIRNMTPSLVELPKWEYLAARGAHYLLYLLMIALPITGWLMSSAAGFPVSFFGLFTLPDMISANENHRILLATIHEWLAYSLIAVISLHVCAALKHYFINKDLIMQRMIRP